jgi:Uma2 family endonuclease
LPKRGEATVCGGENGSGLHAKVPAEKFRQYRSLESLREYVLVSQKRMQVECFRRQAGEQWLLTEASRAEDTVALDSIDCALRLADVYEEIELSGETAA